MLLFNAMESGKVYKNHKKISLPYGKKNTLKDNLVTILSMSDDDTLNILKSNVLDTKNYYKYWVDRIVKIKVTNKTYTINNDYKEIGQKLSNKSLEYQIMKTPAMVKDYNVIAEIGIINKIISEDPTLIGYERNKRGIILSQKILGYIKEIDKKFNHTNKTMLIPVDKYITDTKDSKIFSEVKYRSNPVIAIYNVIKTRPEYMAKEFKNWKIAFLNGSEIFYIECKDINEDTDILIQELFKTFTPYSNAGAKNITDTEAKDEANSTKKKLDKEKKTKTLLAGSNLSEKTYNEIEKVIDDPEETKKKLSKELDMMLTPASKARMARVDKIKNKYKELKIDGKTSEELMLMANNKSISTAHLNVPVINEDMKTQKFMNFDKDYMEKLFDNDIMNILNCFSEKDRPLYLIKLDREDTSTSIDKKYTYKAVYEDENGKRHNLTFDLPKLKDHRYVHLNKSDKLFITQYVPLPVTKTAPDTVQVATDYNKIFIARFGKNLSPKITRFNKIIDTIPATLIFAETGKNVTLNNKYFTTLEYDELANKYTVLKLKKNGLELHFNQDRFRKYLSDAKIPYKATEKLLPFALKDNKEVIYIDTDKDRIHKTNLSPIDFIIEELTKVKPSFKNDFIKMKPGKRYMYSRASIMAKKVPLILLLAFLEGLESVLNMADIKYKFVEKKERLTGDDALNKSIIEFKDGYLIYDQFPFRNSLLMNGFSDIPSEDYEYMQFNGKDIYFDIFQTMFGRRNIGTAFENFHQNLIYPIVKDVLVDNNLPTDFTPLMLYANSLLEDNSYRFDGHLGDFRMRTNELMNAHLYKVLVTAYENYRNTADQRNPKKFSIPPNAVINHMSASQIMEEYSELNPIYEMERLRSTSFKGIAGCNMDRAFSMEKRAYNETMLGVMAQSSPISANIGISRVMSIDPNITSLRGYIKPGDKKDLKNIKQQNMLSGAEMLVPLAAENDDPQRVCMASTQSRHTISTIDSDVPLFGYGMERVLPQMISNNFVYRAKEDGTVLEINNKLGYMILQYKSGKRDVVNISSRQGKNAGGGFYIPNTLTSNVKEGEKFIKDQPVARDDNFFAYDSTSKSCIYKSGPLATVAIMHSSSTFEDSTIVTEAFGTDRMSSKIAFKKDITLGENANIYHSVNIGDEVKVNDPLLVFDESYEDEYLNQFLDKLSLSDREEMIKNSQTPVKSPYNGKIVKINLYYTVPKDELSESLQELIASYEKDIRKRRKAFKKHEINMQDMTYLNETFEPTKPINGKVKGVKMNDSKVLIEYIIEVLDKFSVGDKLTYATALKGINHDLIPRGQEPYRVSRPDDKIDAIMGVTGYYARMTNSFPKTLGINTGMLAMEDKLKAIRKKHFNR